MSQIQQASVVTNSIHLDIDKNDILAIAISRAEAGLASKVELLSTQAKETDKLIATKITELQNQAEANVPAEFRTKLANIIDGLRAFDIAANTTSDMNRITKELYIRLISKVGSGINYIASKTFTFSELGVDDDEIIKLEEQSREMKETSLKTRKQLNNIGSLERTVRGKLAEARLRDTAGGEAIVEAVLADLDLNVKALPSF